MRCSMLMPRVALIAGVAMDGLCKSDVCNVLLYSTYKYGYSVHMIHTGTNT